MCFIHVPHSSATCWECWAVTSAHTQPFSFPPLMDLTAPGRNMAAGNLHECLRKISELHQNLSSTQPIKDCQHETGVSLSKKRLKTPLCTQLKETLC